MAEMGVFNDRALAEIELILQDSFTDVVSAEGSLSVGLGNFRAFITAAELGDSTCLRFIVPLLRDLDPSPLLYRWVATSDPLIGALSARLNDDGGVNIWYIHKTIDCALMDDDLLLVLQVMNDNGQELFDEGRRLFG